MAKSTKKRPLRYFDTPEAVLEYLLEVAEDTLQQEVWRMEREPERSFYSRQDRWEALRRLSDVRSVLPMITLKTATTNPGA